KPSSHIAKDRGRKCGKNANGSRCLLPSPRGPNGQGQGRHRHRTKARDFFYNALRFGMSYVDPGASYYEQRYRQRVIQHIQRRARHFGFTLVEDPTATAGVSEEACTNDVQRRLLWCSNILLKRYFDVTHRADRMPNYGQGFRVHCVRASEALVLYAISAEEDCPGSLAERHDAHQNGATRGGRGHEPSLKHPARRIWLRSASAFVNS